MKKEKYVDYMWLLRVGGSILLLLSIMPSFANQLYVVPFLCTSVDIILWYYDKRVPIIIVSSIAAIITVVMIGWVGLRWILSPWKVVGGMNFPIDFLYGGLTIIAMIGILAAYVLCCCNKRIAAMIISMITSLAILIPILGAALGYILESMFVRNEPLWSIVVDTDFLTNHLYASLIKICILAVFILCCCNKRTAATVVCIAVALVSMPVLAYMEAGMPVSVFYNIYVFFGGVFVIAWSWIMDSDFPIPVEMDRV